VVPSGDLVNGVAETEKLLTVGRRREKRGAVAAGVDRDRNRRIEESVGPAYERACVDAFG